MEKGKLIEIRVQGERRLAVVDRPEGKKDWMVIDAGGQSHKIRPQRIEYQIEGGPYVPQEIPQFLQQVQPYIDPSSLEVAWELLAEEKGGVTPSELAQLLFSEKNPPQCYAAHSLLCEDKIYFKKKGENYEPRPSSQVEEIKHQLEVEQQKQQEKEQFLTKIKQAIAQETVEWSESDRSRLDLLERMILQPEQNHRNAQDLLTEIGRSPSLEAAFELLVELGWWSRHENLFLRRSSYPLQFPKKVLDVAQSSLQMVPPDQDSDRLDLTHLKVYTIDDESTAEIDDGLSVEFLSDDQVKLWIHIADPTRLISPGDELDLEARRRSTTLYLPTGMISMFPVELATGPMSLIQGKICASLSFAVTLDSQGAVLDYSIHASLIKPTYRLTYHDVDEMLQLGIKDEPEIPILAEAAKKRHLWRQSQGAINIKMPEAMIKVKSEDEIIIELIETSPSRQLVAEMMIMAGEVAGRYCQEHGLPVPFRGQPQPELPSDEELLVLPPGPVRACALRRCMPRSEIGTLPNRHASLGLNTYTQVTSPIRRYTDLLTHFQLKAHLRGDSLPFSLDMMQQILYSVTLSAQEASLVERQTNRYWGLEFLRRNAKEIWQGVVLRWLREDENFGILLLEELGLELPHRFERAVSLGDRLNVQVSCADPHRDEIRFREMLEHEVQSSAI
ncbi:MAG TPA: RNB domain-containing ribonuclease [Cyanothece sp. UBA12306]|nr:RNB domain-containing ribonuclease [Cyanothece sp. UBA12306]